jgi:choline-phosphate cytidylyltransferase/glycerol-3-phosphate cytidylyltransferase
MIANKTVVYTSGTFDMLHYNHLKMIEYARALGDILIVGVNTDELVMSYKSEPIIPFEERIALMKALKYPDIVIPQNSLDHRDKVQKLNFDIFVVGDDWAGKFDYLKKLGVSVVYFPYGKGISSSSLKQKIYENYEKMQKRADSHFPQDIAIMPSGQ